MGLYRWISLALRMGMLLMFFNCKSFQVYITLRGLNYLVFVTQSGLCLTPNVCVRRSSRAGA